MFICGILGVQLYTFVGKGLKLQEPRNFRTIGNACQLLLQCLTADGWSQLMIDTLGPPEAGACEEYGLPASCESSQVTPHIYFISFILLGVFCILNLVIAVILENFSLWESSIRSSAQKTISRALVRRGARAEGHTWISNEYVV